MSSSHRIETTAAQTASETGFAPRCPECGGGMIVRAHRHGDDVDGLFWGCRRPLVCNGRRRIRDPLVIQPTADASTTAIFEWERARDRRGWVSPDRSAAASHGLLGRLGRGLLRPGTNRAPSATHATPVAAGQTVPSGLQSLIEYGFVVLDSRSVISARAAVDHLVVGPTGLFVVDQKPWPGQLSVSGENVYVDGRMRTGVADEVTRASGAVQESLAHELKPVGAQVHAVILFDSATNPSFEATIGKVALAARRSVAKVLRSGDATLGPETVVRLALAADRLLD